MNPKSRKQKTRTIPSPNKKYGGIILATLAFFLVMASARATGGYPAVDSAVTLYYHLNNNSSIGENSTFVVNSIVGGTNATTNATFIVGGGILGDGDANFSNLTSMNIKTNGTTYLGGSSGYSFSFWINPTITGTYRMRPIASNNLITGFMGNTGNTGKDYTWFIGNGTGLSGGATAASFFTTNTWTHVVITYNKTTGVIYKDGLQFQTQAFSSSSINSSAILYLGSSNTPADFFNGELDEVMLYNRSITAAEVWNLYNTYKGCVNLTEGTTYVGNVTVCPSTTFSFNDTAATGAVIIGADGVIFDCQGSILQGNVTSGSTPQSRGITFSSTARTGSTIKNCVVNGYWASIRPRGTSHTFQNITINNSFYGYDFEFTNSSSIINSTMTNIRSIGVYTSSAYNNYLDRMNISAPGGRYDVFIESPGNNNVVSNGTFLNNSVHLSGAYNNVTQSYIEGNTTSLGIDDSGDNNTFSYNTLVGLSSRIDVSGDGSVIKHNVITNITAQSSCIAVHIAASRVNVFNNTLDNCDIGVWLSKGSYINVTDNRINNTFNHYDSYDAGIMIEPRASNLILARNNISNFGTVGIGVKNGTNVTIANNSISGLTNRTNRGYYDYNEPQTAIGLYELYKGFSGDQLANNSWTQAQTQYYRNTNVSISGNTIDNVDLLLLDVNTSMLTQDISNYWFRSFVAPLGIMDKFNFYANASSNNISRVDSTFQINYTLTQNTLFNVSVNYQVNRNYTFVQNNLPIAESINFFNLTDALIYTNNGSVPCTDLPSCDNNQNYTLSGNNSSYVLDRYTFNQSAAARPYDPISVANSSSNVRALTSTLTSTLTNVSVTIRTGGLIPSSPYLLHPDGTSEYISYSYDNLSSEMTFTTSIQSGINNLYIVGTPTQQNCQNSISGLGNFSNVIPSIFTILGLTVLVTLVLVGASSFGYIDIDLMSVAPYILIGLMAAIFIGLFATGATNAFSGICIN